MGKTSVKLFVILLLGFSLLLLFSAGCANPEPTVTPTVTPALDKDINWHLEWNPEGYFKVSWTDYPSSADELIRFFVYFDGRNHQNLGYLVNSQDEEYIIMPLRSLTAWVPNFRCLQVKSGVDSFDSLNPIGESKKICWRPCSLVSHISATVISPNHPRVDDLFLANTQEEQLQLLFEDEETTLELKLTLGETAILRVFSNPSCSGESFTWFSTSSILKVETFDFDEGAFVVPFQEGEETITLRTFSEDAVDNFDIFLKVIVGPKQ